MAAAHDRTLTRRFLGLAWPNILANLMVPLASLVDTAMLGHLADVRHLAGVALASVVFDYLLWTFGFLRMGTTGLTAQALGRRDAKEVGLVVARAMIVAVIGGATLVALQGPIADLSFRLLEGSAGLRDAGREYFSARIWGAPAALANFVLLGWFLGNQSSRRVLVMSVVGNGANIFLDYLFIYRFDMGSAGAGYATMLSQYLMLGVGLALAWPLWRDIPGPLQRAAVFERKAVRELTRLSGDIVVRTFALITAFALFTNFSAGLSVAVLAANTVLLRVITLASYFVDGFAFATESVVGLAWGQRDRSGLRRALSLALVCGEITGLTFAFAFCLFPDVLFGLITNHPELLERIASDRWWLVPLLAFGSVAYVLDGYFLGLSAGRVMSRAMVLSLAGFLPLALWGRYVAFDSTHLWAALWLFMVLRVVTLWRAVPKTWRQLPSET